MQKINNKFFVRGGRSLQLGAKAGKEGGGLGMTGRGSFFEPEDSLFFINGAQLAGKESAAEKEERMSIA